MEKAKLEACRPIMRAVLVASWLQRARAWTRAREGEEKGDDSSYGCRCCLWGRQ